MQAQIGKLRLRKVVLPAFTKINRAELDQNQAIKPKLNL